MSELSDNIWFDRGKRARSDNNPRTLLDGRVSALNRDAWKRGWDYQDDYLANGPETSEQREARLAEQRAGLEAICQSLQS